MAISIGQMNSYLKKYTDSLLTLHGIPLTGEFEENVEDYLKHFTARKTLETAMWQLCQHAEAKDGYETYEYQNDKHTIQLAEYVALEGHGAICIDKMKTLDPECLFEKARDYLQEQGYELIRPTSDHVSKHISAEARAAALEEYGRTGRKPDELLTDEEIIAGRVQIAAHNLEAKRRHEARQKK
jgi:hypothetical protein